MEITENEGQEIPPEKKYPNLIPAKKGEVRNPKGRPKGSPNLKTLISKWMEVKEKVANPFNGKEQKLTQADIMVLKMISMARKGNVAAWVALTDRLEGKPEQQLSHKVPEGTKMKVIIGQPFKMKRMQQTREDDGAGD